MKDKILRLPKWLRNPLCVSTRASQSTKSTPCMLTCSSPIIIKLKQQSPQLIWTKIEPHNDHCIPYLLNFTEGKKRKVKKKILLEEGEKETYRDQKRYKLK